MDNEGLTKPRTVTHTLYKLYNMMVAETIDLQPDFQRAVVWTPSKQSLLIDSILKNFYIPPIILSCRKSKKDSNRWIRICIDGKQRLTSIRQFMDNAIPHADPMKGSRARRYYKPNNGRKNHLSAEERELFDCSELICVEYYDLTHIQEIEIFSRVQLGMALTSAEKLKAISSPMAAYVQKIQDDYPSLELIIEKKRARPFQLITQSLHMIETEPVVFCSTPAVIGKYLKNTRQAPKSLMRTAERVYQTLDALIEADSASFHQSNKFAPIEFVLFSWLIAKNPDLSIAQYQQYLLEMKEYVREHHVDIRFNSPVYSTLKRFVEHIDEKHVTKKRRIIKLEDESSDSSSCYADEPMEIKSESNDDASFIVRLSYDEQVKSNSSHKTIIKVED